MPTLKRGDFPDKAAFLNQLSIVLATQGAASPAVRDLMALANEDADWWNDAQLLYQRRREFEALLGGATPGAPPDGGVNIPPLSANPNWIALVIRPALEMLGSVIASSRLQGAVIGLVTAVLGYLGYSATVGTSPPTPDPPPANVAIQADSVITAIAETVAADPRIKSLVDEAVAEIARRADVDGLKSAAVERIVASAKAEGLVGQAVDDIVKASAAETIPDKAAARVEAVVKSEAFTIALAEKLRETFRSEPFIKSVADEVAKQASAADSAQAVVDALMRSDDFFKKVAIEVKK